MFGVVRCRELVFCRTSAKNNLYDLGEDVTFAISAQLHRLPMLDIYVQKPKICQIGSTAGRQSRRDGVARAVMCRDSNSMVSRSEESRMAKHVQTYTEERFFRDSNRVERAR